MSLTNTEYGTLAVNQNLVVGHGMFEPYPQARQRFVLSNFKIFGRNQSPDSI